MTIKNNTVVSFHYRLSEAGKELENSYDDSPMLTLVGHNNVIPGLEAALIGKAEGDKFAVSLPPEQAYGPRIDRELMRVPIKHLLDKPKKVKLGQIVYIDTQEGQCSAIVMKVGKFNVDLDTNHPFAGKTLDFDIEIVATREATQQEIQHGHAHGVGGHQH